ncbi:MAG TPA: VOC family protein [Terriglobales bacterium]|nr:VOC family protein [Terriglobales bacterium]
MKRFIQTRAAGLLIALVVLSGVVRAQQLQATRVENAGFTVSEMERSVDFYSRVLHFQKVGDRRTRNADGRVVQMQLGEEQIELAQYDAKGRPFPPDSHSNDHWFQHVAIVVSDMPKAYAVLRQNRVRHASSAPQRLPDWNQNAAGIEAFYFRDPDGHYLELIHFPAGKGDPKWQRPSEELFLGIDHTAIVVADTDQSLRFYRDLLGMHIAGESENYGVEQEHLNGVFAAHLRITSLRAERGPGIELLEYLAPTDGRETPSDVHANDIAHWETRVEFNDTTARQAWDELRAANITLASSRPRQGQEPGGQFLAQDPDRHAIIFHCAKPNTISRITSAVEGERQ